MNEHNGDKKSVSGAPGDGRADVPQLGLVRASWQGARTGFRLMAYVAGSIVAVYSVGFFALVAVGVGSGRGSRGLVGAIVQGFALRALRFFLAAGLLGGLCGAVIGPIGALIRRAARGRRAEALWTVGERPVRLFGERRNAAAVEALPTRPRRRLWPWLVGVPVLLIWAAAFGTGGYLGRRADRRLAEAVAVADRDDPSWRLGDLMAHREPVPDKENSALVVHEALSHLPEGWPAGPPSKPGEPNAPPAVPYDILNREAATPDNVRLDDDVADTLRGELKTHQEAVRLARTVADYRRGRHRLRLGPALIDTALPETQATRTAARLLAIDAAIRAQDGDLDGALDSCRAILGVGRSIGDEPFLISQLVRMAIGMVATQSARRALAQGEPSDTALARLQALLLDERAQPLQLHGLRGERAIQPELIRRVADGEVPFSALSGGPAVLPRGQTEVIAPWGKLMFDTQQAVALEWMNEAVAIARRPAVERPALWKAWQARLDREKSTRFGQLFEATLPLLLTPAVASADQSFKRFQSDLGAMAIVLAAERHRRKTGDWPASIAAIDPAILPEAPRDPYSGEPFHMARRDGHLRVYSVGPNRRDDQGEFNPKTWARGGPDDIGTAAWDVPLRGRPAGSKVTPTAPEEAAGAGSASRPVPGADRGQRD